MFPIPKNEVARLRALHELDVLDSAREPQFDALCRTAQSLFQVPIALVSLVGESEQWFKAVCGLDADRTSRDVSFCAHAILSQEVLVVEDATRDERFAHNPLVTGAPSIRFYAGAPLVVSPGIQVGSICVIDREPRSFSEEQRGQLADLAQVVVAQLRLRNAELQAREREALLRESEERLELALESGSGGVWEWNQGGGGLSFSPHLPRLLGHGGEGVQAGSKTWNDLIHPEDRGSALRLFRDHLAGRSALYESEHRLQRQDGTYIWTFARGRAVQRNASGRVMRVVGTSIDITARKKAEQHIEHLARHDVLTDLPNRALFSDRLVQRLAEIKRQGGHCAVHFGDLDRFKAVNDTYGHATGDAVLVEVARRLKSVVREEDTVARLGGDEFAVLQVGAEMDSHRAARLASRLIEAISRPIQVGDIEIRIGLSLGIALAPEHGLDLDRLLKRADAALYDAKSEGRCGFRLWHEVLENSVSADQPDASQGSESAQVCRV